MKKILISALSSALLLAGCSLEPDYARPEAPVPAAWPSGPAYDGAAATRKPDGRLMADLGWREFFRSEPLQRVIETALRNNRDLRVAALNIEQARAQYRIERAALVPNLAADASGTRARTPASLSATGQAMTASQYSVQGGIAAYEVDLFGRVRSLRNKALEEYFATAEARDAVEISLIAEVANAWLTLQADRQLLALTEETLATQEESFRLIGRSYERGVASGLDLAQAQTSVETARVNRALYLRQVAQDRNALTLLVGAPLDDAELPAGAMVGVESLVADLPAGLPSDLLQRRPDIREAEHRLKAASANIGAARAAFFPNITLTATGGTASSALSDLFAAGTGAWLFSPAISLPIFDAGRNQANLDAAKAQRDIGVAQYEKTIQSAFREVADALAGRGTFEDQVKAQAALVAAAGESHRLAKLRYDKGIDSYLNVLDAQRSLYGAQQALIGIELGRLNNLVTLYKVLGGGLDRMEAERE